MLPSPHPSPSSPTQVLWPSSSSTCHGLLSPTEPAPSLSQHWMLITVCSHPPAMTMSLLRASSPTHHRDADSSPTSAPFTLPLTSPCRQSAPPRVHLVPLSSQKSPARGSCSPLRAPLGVFLAPWEQDTHIGVWNERGVRDIGDPCDLAQFSASLCAPAWCC